MDLAMFNSDYKRATENIEKTKMILNKIKNHKNVGKQINLLSPVIAYELANKEYNMDEIIEMLLTKKTIMYRD